MLCAFLLCSSTVGVHFYYVQAFSVCSSFNSQHFSLCAFLPYSSTESRGKVPNVSTLCLHVYAYFYCITIVSCLLSSSVSIHFIQHFSICTFCFLLHFYSILLHFVWWWLSFYCIFFYILVLILSKLNDMGPYGIFLTTWHLISRHHGEIYTTRSVQSDRTSNASCRFSHFGIHVPFNFYHFNPNFSLPVLLKV